MTKSSAFTDGDAVNVLRSLAAITAGTSGLEFLRRATTHLQERVGAVAVVLGELIEDDTELPTASIASLAHAGPEEEPFELVLVGTAAGACISHGKTLSLTRADLQQTFPEDQFLKVFDFSTCIAAPVILSDGEPAGFLTTLLTQPVEECRTLISVMEIAAERIGSELQRISYQSVATKNEMRFRDFAEAASDWFWEMDEKLRFSFFSERFTEITGVPKEALLGKTRQETGIPNVDPEAWQDHLDALAAHQPFKNFVHPRTKDDGKVVWLSISGRPIFEPDGGFRGYRGIGEDITEMKEKEEALVEAIEKAQRASSSKAEFLANMSHEIRTPMNGVMGMAELLSRTELDDKQQSFADVILKSGDTLLHIINDILDFSKIEAGQMVLENKPFDLAETVDEVAANHSETAAKKGLKLAVHVDPTLPALLVGDAGRLGQAINNLVGNAVKYTETGEVSINVTAVPKAKLRTGSCKLLISVEDTGAGIPENQLAAIFDRSTQANDANSQRQGGAGLGLAISSSLIELMGGELEAQSRLGEGATFYFSVTLPAHETDEQVPTVPRNLSGSSILVVDDNELNRSMMLEQLERWNFEAAACKNALQAKAVLSAAVQNKIPIDLIILDYAMPDVNGAELALDLKKTPGLAGIPIIMLTSVEQTSDGERFSRLGVQACLIKPTRSAMLLKTITQALQASPSTAAVTPTEDLALPAEEQFTAPFTDDAPIDVLVADDNEVNRSVFTQILTNAGYSYKIARNGAEAVQYFQKYRPSVVCMDVSMPVMNGFEATGEIRKLERDVDSHTPIIGITAHALAQDRIKCEVAGMDDYLAKPVSPQALIEMISSWHALQDRQTA